jgi:hypothetical protein
MTRLTLLTTALVLLLLAFPLVSIGTVQNIEALWWLGLLALLVGGILPPLARFTHPVSEDNNEAAEEADG